MNEGEGSMLFRESETIELKEVVVDEIKKEIIAFANCLNFLSFLTLNANCSHHLSPSGSS